MQYYNSKKLNECVLKDHSIKIQVEMHVDLNSNDLTGHGLASRGLTRHGLTGGHGDVMVNYT